MWYNSSRERISGGVIMDKQLSISNLTYLFDTYTDIICKKKNIGWEQFKQLNAKYGILKFIAENREIFDEYSFTDGMKLIEKSLLSKE